MKIQTSTGDVELTAEMVCRGMVFLHLPSGHTITTIRPYKSAPGVIASAPGAWECNPGGVLFDVQRSAKDPDFRPIGCDPTIATRADCERFGVHGDAAAHGFARLKTGGAVDFRRAEAAVPGMVLRGRKGETVTTMVQRSDGLWSVEGWPADEWTPPAADYWERFVGLNAEYARPEDLRRFCCGAAPNGDVGDSRRCSLAIGDHDEHEDLATGTKWEGEWREHTPGTETGVVRATALAHAQKTFAARDRGALAEMVGPESEPQMVLVRFGEGLWERTQAFVVVAVSPERLTVKASLDGFDPGVPTLFAAICEAMDRGDGVRVARGGERFEAHVLRAQTDTDPMRHEGINLTLDLRRVAASMPSPTFRGLPFPETPEQIVRRAAIEWRPEGRGDVAKLGDARAVVAPGFPWSALSRSRLIASGPDSPDAKRHAERWLRELACSGDALHAMLDVLALVFRVWDASAAGQQAALVSLVAAVPPDLDPIGWRAAVLAAREVHGLTPAPIVIANLIRRERSGAVAHTVHAAYQRATTPHRASPPERHGATWKTRGPRLTVDDGRDE